MTPAGLPASKTRSGLVPRLGPALLAALLSFAGCRPPPGGARLHQPVDTRFLADLTATRSYQLGRPRAMRFTPDNAAVLFLRSGPRSAAQHLYELDLASGSTRRLLTPADVLKGARESLSPEEKARRERTRTSTQGFAGFQLSPDGKSVLLSVSGRLYRVDRASKSVRELPTSKGVLLNPRFSPDGSHLAYVIDHDLYALELGAGVEKRLTQGGSRDLSHGLAEFVAQEEMDRMRGYWWAPDSRSIAYEEADTRGVELWHVANPARPGQAPQPQRYPRPGKQNAVVRVGVVAIAAGSATRWLEWDAVRYPYLCQVSWHKGGPLTLVVQDRVQQEEQLLAADAETGKTRTLFVERDPAWLNLDPQMPRWLEDGSGFLWTSEREGAWQLELRAPDGALRQVIVPPAAGYAGLLWARSAGEPVFYAASVDPLERHLWRTSLTPGATPVQLTREAGHHGAVFSKDGSRYAASHAGAGRLGRTTVLRADGEGVPLALPSVAERPPFVPTTVIVSVGEEGFRCAVTRPRAFVAGKRYPVIHRVYGGPHAQVVLPQMGRWLRTQWLADQGFVVTSCDGRGTPRRRRAWERALRGSFVDVPLGDQVRALRLLGRRFPELDLERVGVEGWSFGGYLSALAALREPSLFKAAVAGAPVTDWLDYDTYYTERYLGLPVENPRGYGESNLVAQADKLSRPLLLIHGTSDDNVFFRHTLRLSEALFRAGKYHELLALPGFTHMLPDPVVRARLEERIVTFFQRHL